MHKIRTKRWMQDWLDERFGSKKGRVIEELLLEKYGEEMAEYNKQINATQPAREDLS